MENRGGVYNPGEQVELQINGVWRPARIQGVANYTVRNSITRGETNKPPNQVFPDNGNANNNGANTNIIPGSPIRFQGPHRWIVLPGILVSKNYNVQIDGRTETVPHTRIRRAQAANQNGNNRDDDEEDDEEEDDNHDDNYAEGEPVDVLVEGVWRPGNIGDIVNYTVLNTATGNNITIEEEENIRGLQWRINSPLEFRQGAQWFPGTLTSINYSVNMEDGLRIASTLNIRPRQVVLAPAPATVIFTRGQRVEVNEDGVWRPGVVGMLDDFTVRNTATGRNVNRQNTQVFPVTPLVGNRVFMPGDRVQFEDGRRLLPGTLVSRNYYVTIDNGMIESVPHTRIRLAAGQPQAAAQAAARPQAVPRPAAVAQAAARPQPTGVAFEIHNAFPELNFNKFMDIVRKDNNGASNFKDSTYPLQPLINYINTDKSTTIVDTVIERTGERIPEKTDTIRDLNDRIKDQINAYLSAHPENRDNVMEMIQFVMSQGVDYKDPYIRFLVFDCMNAYRRDSRNPNSGASCAKGMFERVFLTNKSVIIPLCSDDTSSAASSSSSTCKPVYRELLGCFYPDMDLNALFGEWYDINNLEEGSTSPLANASEEERKEDFRRFVLNKVPRADPTAINNYIQRNENTFKTLLIGGRRRNRKTKRKSLRKSKNKTLRRGKRKTKRRY